MSNERPRVILLTPYYSQVSMGLHNTLNLASRDPSLLTVACEAQVNSSILPHTFNVLLGAALDARDDGRVTHMAMAHSDICAEPGWLDTLYRETLAHEADLVSAVVPIKGPSGRTSTAVGDVDEPWRIKRSVYLEERWDRPQTFGAQDVCGPGEVLLVNTGLFLADLRRPWWDDFAFQFHTRLRKTERGHVAESRPEDWEMSRHLHKHGAKVMATYKVRLTHEGGCMYANYEERRGLAP